MQILDVRGHLVPRNCARPSDTLVAPRRPGCTKQGASRSTALAQRTHDRDERHEDMRAVLEKAMAFDGPSFIEMPCVSEDVIAPFVPKWVSGARVKKRPSVY